MASPQQQYVDKVQLRFKFHTGSAALNALRA